MPYSFDTRGILSTLACGVHGRLKTTTDKAIMYERDLEKQSRQEI